MTTADWETVFVAGERSFVVRESRADAPRWTTVTVTMDGRSEWSFRGPGWRPVSFGASRHQSFLWSARELIVLPRSEGDEPEVIPVDEDLLYVFRVDGGWLMVCETSVRRVIDGRETDRIELDDVADQARWSRGALRVVDRAGEVFRLHVKGTRLDIGLP